MERSHLYSNNRYRVRQIIHRYHAHGFLQNSITPDWSWCTPLTPRRPVSPTRAMGRPVPRSSFILPGCHLAHSTRIASCRLVKRALCPRARRWLCIDERPVPYEMNIAALHCQLGHVRAYLRANSPRELSRNGRPIRYDTNSGSLRGREITAHETNIDEIRA
jgi:hypothetical protein